MTQQETTELTPQQARAASMLASGRRMGATAKTVGVHRVTLWEWTRLGAFQLEMNDLRRAAWRSARDRMRENTAKAAHVLGSILSDSTAKPQDRIAAARVVLAATGPLFAEEGTADTLESRGLPPITGPRDWSTAGSTTCAATRR